VPQGEELVQHFFSSFGLNVDVWKDLPRDTVSLGVCVSGCCGGVASHWEFDSSGMVRIWVPKTRLGAMPWGEEEFIRATGQEERGRACIACYGVEAIAKAVVVAHPSSRLPC
jgi:hypothetical protein